MRPQEVDASMVTLMSQGSTSKCSTRTWSVLAKPGYPSVLLIVFVQS